MTTPPDPPVVEPGSNEPRSKEQIEAEIQATRLQLGQTVDALSHRLDVKSRLKEQAQEAREQAVRQLHERPAVPVAVAAGLVLLTTLLLWRRRRRG